jgi:hypothetical protein
MPTLHQLLSDLRPDEWRAQVGFSHEVQDYHKRLFAPSASRVQIAGILNDWLQTRRHPCQFGRMAAIKGRHRFCVLTENDLRLGDQHLLASIAEARSGWKRDCISGDTSSLIVAIVCQVLANAQTNAVLHGFALRFCDMILGRAVEDTMLLDDVELDTSVGRLCWKAGASFFASQGDGRWWHDHRFPGGMAFSLNSIGHMTAIRCLETRGAAQDRHRIHSLQHWALPRAMHSVEHASNGAHRCTWLTPYDSAETVEWLPIAQRQKVLASLAECSVRTYRGRYHTDHTIPSPLFDVSRPEGPVDTFALSFSYLHDDHDPEYMSIGLGVPCKP